MKKYFYMPLLGFVPVMLQSCASVYVPGAQNVPLLKEKGQVKLAAGLYDYQAAYAVGPHAAVMVNAQNSDRVGSELVASTKKSYREVSKMVEVGGGYFTDAKNTWTFEAYGGVGVFKTRLRSNYQDLRSDYPNDNAGKDSSYSTLLNTRGTRFFVQPSFGYASKAVDIAFSTRIIGLSFGSVKQLSYSDIRWEQSDLGKLNGRMHLFAEPAITMRVGYKWLKAQIQTGVSLRITSSKVPYNYLFGSVGLVGDIGKWYE
jgi:hypothetical protein